MYTRLCAFYLFSENRKRSVSDSLRSVVLIPYLEAVELGLPRMCSIFPCAWRNMFFGFRV
jgi:hypothetical protein